MKTCGSVRIFLIFPLIITLVHGLCPKGEGVVFSIPHKLKLPQGSDACFKDCAETSCTGVRIFSDACFSVDLAEYYGKINEAGFVRKQCVKGIPTTITMTEYSNATVGPRTEMIIQTPNKIDCLAKCIEESFCRSVMFYPATNECLMNSVNSTSIQLEAESDGSMVNYLEFKKLKSEEPCISSFRHTSYEKIQLRGDVKISNGSDGMRKCLDRCVDCDAVMYNELYSECFVVQLDSSGQPLDFLNEEYHIFTSLCRTPPPACSPYNSIYIARHSLDMELKKECLEKCIADSSCIYAYANENEGCITSEKPRQQPASIMRKCSGIEQLPYGVLFEESEVCRETPSQLQVDDVDMTQCMQLCLTHPTQSCEAISYYGKKRSCLLHDTLVITGRKNLDCSHYSLSIIQIETERRKSESKSRKKAFAAKSSSVKPEKNNKSELEPMQTNFDDVKMQTICHIDTIQINITSPHRLQADVFVRNAHEACSVKIHGEKSGSLLIPLKKSGCPIQIENNIYSAVIILKSNAHTNIAVITDEDRMFQIACDYSNQVTTIAKSNHITVGDPKFTELPISGKINVDKAMEMQMETREKRSKLPKSVAVGQEVDLVFRSGGIMKMMKAGYKVRQCIATSNDAKDNMTLIEDGCPSVSASNFILRGGIRYNDDGFLIPFKAFKFQNGDDVNISCKVEICQEGGDCKKPNCSKKRIRRELERFVNVGHGKIEEIGISMKVLPQKDIDTTVPPFCMKRTSMLTLYILIGVFIMIQFSVLLYIVFRKMRENKKF